MEAKFNVEFKISDYLILKITKLYLNHQILEGAVNEFNNSPHLHQVNVPHTSHYLILALIVLNLLKKE